MRHSSARLRGLRIVICVALATSFLTIAAPQGQAAPGENSDPLPNPDLEVACGLDISMILDESGSVAKYKKNVQDAFRAFTGALKNTGSRLAVSEFSTVARLPLTGAAQKAYTPVTDDTIKNVFEPYISKEYNPDGSTNWEDGLRVARYQLPRPSDQPHLTVFITDGDPNKVIRTDNVTPDQYKNKVPLDSHQVADASEDAAADRAVPNANAIKATGSHILAIAVGNGLSSSASLNRLKKVSGPDVYDGTGTFDISTTDIYREPDFSKLKDALREAAFQLCAPSITVRKMVDLTPDTGVSDAVPGPGFDLTAQVSPTPKSWTIPKNGSGNTATNETDGNGFASFQWETNKPTSSNATINEEDPSGVIPGLVFRPDLTSCTYRTPDHPDDQNLPTTSTALGFSTTIPADAIVTCTIYNAVPAAPKISIKKYTNGVDADVAPGPSVPIGDPVAWTYDVTNTGTVTLNNVAVADNKLGDISCPSTSLAPGATMTCLADGTAKAGQYANVGSVSADYKGTTVKDSDPSHYTGVTPGIDIEKATNGQDADDPPGPYVTPGSTVTWTYVVTNTGAPALTNVAVTDDQLGAVSCPSTTLAAGASMTCTETGTAVAGQYENNATATGTAGTQTVSDSDASHYFGSTPSVSLRKFTNGHDANSPTGPLVPQHRRVVWFYVVRNNGNVPLHSLSVTDDQGVTVHCPTIGQLLPGHRTICIATGHAQAGQYANIGTVTALDPAGGSVSDTDPSHYFGVAPDIKLTKFTDGQDANTAPGPFIPVGDPVTWTYQIENTGNVTLSDIGLADSPEGTITCPSTMLAVGGTMTCTASGTAAADQYSNTGYVTGTDPLGEVVTDDDPSNYFGAAPGIAVEKSTNGDDADQAPGPYIPVGNNVTWTYLVSNSGNLPLSNVTVTDDQGVSVDCPQTSLAPHEQMTCTAHGVAINGQYANVATASGENGGTTYTDTDPSHYFGYVTSLKLTKYTMGEDANLPTGPYITPGSKVLWTYVVKNTGDVPIDTWKITDSDPSVNIACPKIASIQPGDSLNCSAAGSAKAGQYANRATVDALDRLENKLTDSDPSHYFGAVPKIHLEKSTNGEDADSAPGPEVTQGSTVNWKYFVTNTGNVPLESVKVTDDQLGAVDCPKDQLAVGASMTCRATGTAQAGQYKNVGTATGQFVPADTGGGAGTITEPVSVHDKDPSHYFGIAEGGGNEPGVPGGGNEPGGPGGGELPGTGANLAPLAWGLGMLLIGSIFLLAGRRRRDL
jgi:hypothetical protein